MKKGFRYALFATAVLLFASCSATKYVPEGSYLLDEVRIHTEASPFFSSLAFLIKKSTLNESLFMFLQFFVVQK